MAVERSQTLLILGMHRSGTSALTRMINLLGADLGEHLMPAAIDNNENGFWENQEAVDINEGLLRDLDRNWHDVREMPADWLTSHAAARARESIRDFVRREFRGVKLWALKDPRLCRLAPLWLDVMSELGVDVRVILAVRSPAEVAASLRARDGWSEATSRMLWVQHMREAEAATRGLRRCVITFDEVIADWSALAGRIARELDVAWPVDPADIAAEVGAFINPGARHHAHEPFVRTSASDWANRLYGDFLDARHDPAAWAAITAADDRFRESAAMFAPCVDELTAQLRHTDQLRHYFETLHNAESSELRIARRALFAEDQLEKLAQSALDASQHIENNIRQSTAAALTEALSGERGIQQHFASVENQLQRMSVQHDKLTEAVAQAASASRLDEIGGLLQDFITQQRDNDSGEGASIKRIDLLALGDALSALAKQVEAVNQRETGSRWRRRKGD